MNFRFTSITGSLLWMKTMILWMKPSYLSKKGLYLRTQGLHKSSGTLYPMYLYSHIFRSHPNSKITWALTKAKRTNLVYPALKKLYPLLYRKSTLKLLIWKETDKGNWGTHANSKYFSKIRWYYKKIENFRTLRAKFKILLKFLSNLSVWDELTARITKMRRKRQRN